MGSAEVKSQTFALTPAAAPHFGVRFSLLSRTSTIVLVAFLLRILVMLAAHSYAFPFQSDDTSFQNETTFIAQSLAAGKGFSSPFGGSTGPSAWVGPIYAGLCAAIFRVFGVFSRGSAIAILSMNSVFSALTCIPMLSFGRRLYGETTTVVSAWIWAVLPFFMKWPLTWAWEISLSALLLTALLARSLDLGLGERHSRTDWLWFGVLGGIAVLANPALIVPLFLAMAWLVLVRAKGWKQLSISLLAVILTVAPWIARNRVVFGTWVFVRSNFAFELDLGNYHTSFGMGWMGRHPMINPAEYEQYRRVGELQYVHQHGLQVGAFIRKYPGEFLALCGTRFLAFWDGGAMLYHVPWLRLWMPWLFLPLTYIAAFGLALALGRRVPASGLLAATLLLYPLPYYLAFPQARYRYPVEPFLLLLSVYFVTESIRVLRARTARSRMESVGVPQAAGIS